MAEEKPASDLIEQAADKVERIYNGNLTLGTDLGYALRGELRALVAQATAEAVETRNRLVNRANVVGLQTADELEEALVLLERLAHGATPNFFTGEIVFDPDMEDINRWVADMRTILIKHDRMHEGRANP